MRPAGKRLSGYVQRVGKINDYDLGALGLKIFRLGCQEKLPPGEACERFARARDIRKTSTGLGPCRAGAFR